MIKALRIGVYALLFGSLTGCAAQKLSSKNRNDCGLIVSYDGSLLIQPFLPVKFTIDPSVPEKYRDNVYEAAAKWNTLMEMSMIEIVGVQSNTLALFAEVYSPITYVGSDWEWNPQTIMLTTVYSTGVDITYAPIYINAMQVTDATEKDFTVVMLHEFGHALGLAHGDVATDLMFPSYYPGPISTDNAVENLKCAYR